jgi:hypothetical protein
MSEDVLEHLCCLYGPFGAVAKYFCIILRFPMDGDAKSSVVDKTKNKKRTNYTG